ncbi:hypothetical protein QJQ45_018092 [Haematococcus lacustris]|nr:hypothetical protein QJQ45_018092 [Haematococcus lacustris]
MFSGSDDDAWEDDASDSHDLSRENRARARQFETAGYREGLDAGKEQTLQAGFNQGFAEGAKAGFSWGDTAARAKSACILAGRVPGSGHLQQQAVELAAVLQAIDARDVMLAAFREVLHKEEGTALPSTSHSHELLNQARQQLEAMGLVATA